MTRNVKISAELIDTITKQVFEAVQADLAALRASVVAVTAKLDADAGVTGTDYAATCNPAALKTQR
jgi:hypothetical protein